MTINESKAVLTAFANHQIKPEDLTRPEALNHKEINIMIRQLNRAPKRDKTDFARARQFYQLLLKLYPNADIPAYEDIFQFDAPEIKTKQEQIYDRLVELGCDTDYATVEAAWLKTDNRYKLETTESILKRYDLYTQLVELEWDRRDAFDVSHE